MATDARLWVVDIDGGPSGIWAFDHDGDAAPEVALPAISSIERLLKLEEYLARDPAAAARAGHLQVIARKV